MAPKCTYVVCTGQAFSEPIPNHVVRGRQIKPRAVPKEPRDLQDFLRRGSRESNLGHGACLPVRPSAAKPADLQGPLRAAEGTRTLDLLHGKIGFKARPARSFPWNMRLLASACEGRFPHVSTR